MRMTPFLKTIVLLLTSSIVSGQSILNDYFNGNKDSMIIEATKLINMPEPIFKPYKPTKIDAATLADMGFDQPYKIKNYYFTTRDKKKIFAFQFPKKSQNTIILIHGVKSSAYLYNKMAGLLQNATLAEVFAIDLRGHGKSEGVDGDVDYINQYADDLADIIKAVRNTKPNGKIIIAGHSMGGGVALNYAMLSNNVKIDGFVLFAPLIGNNSPAIPQSVPTKNDIIEPFMQIHIARIIGLKMFNELNNHKYDDLPVLFFNLPENMPSRKYTYRANMSMAPEDYKEGLKAVNVPMLVLIGSKDEAFNADATQKAVIENSKGQVQIIEGATHNGIRHNSQSYVFIKKWFKAL